MRDSPEPAVAAAQPVIPIPPLPSGDLRADLGITTEHYGDYSSRDLVEKADIFWKFFYMTRALQEGHPPPDVASALQALKVAASKLHRDKNAAAIDAILKEIDSGMTAKTLEDRLSQRGIRTASLSWSSGSYDITRELRAPAAVTGELDRRPTASLEDVRRAAEFASHNHKPPAQVQQESFQRAAELTNQLGDTLDEERKLAGAHPIGRDRVDPSSGLTNPFASKFPSSPIR